MSAQLKKGGQSVFSGIIAPGDESAEKGHRTAASNQAAVHRHAGAERAPAAEDGRGGGLHAHLRLGGRPVLRDNG